MDTSTSSDKRNAAKPGHWAGVSISHPMVVTTLAHGDDRTNHPALVATPELGLAQEAEDRTSDRATREAPSPALTTRRSVSPNSEREPDFKSTESGAAKKRIAVLVAHGMGQQLPFETLDAVSEALCTEYVRHAGGDKPKVEVRYATFGDDWTPRAEFTIRTNETSAEREVHLYEAYWAPFTEGEIGIAGVFAFIVGAAQRGVRYGREGFGRYLFGSYVQCALSTGGLVALALAFAVILLAGFAFTLFWAAALTEILSLLHVPSWRLGALATVWRLSLYPMCGLLAIVLVATACAILRTIARKNLRDAIDRERIRGAVLTSVIMLAAAIAIVWGAWALRHLTAEWMFRSDIATSLAVVGLGIAALFVNMVNKVVVQYLGDVAIYVSAFAVNRYWKIRSQIQGAGRTLARNVYGAVEGDTLLYDHVFVVGHSLGSVVAYDMLNDSIQRDLLTFGVNGRSLNVVGRTPLLLTFGSPLDKIAFFFRTQADALATREALSSATQPLIRDYRLRPANWINIWSPFDWISGALDYYDRLDPDHRDPREVVNRIDGESPVLVFGAHPGYWKRRAFTKTLYDAVTQV